MDLYRDENGFLDISDYVSIIDTGLGYSDFDYNGKHYYFKSSFRSDLLYDELIAEEIAKEMGIECCHYDLATIGDDVCGVISESRENEFDEVFTLNELFRDLPDNYEFHLNLEDVWNILAIKYKDSAIVKQFMDDYVKLFMFDIIIGNPDRHGSNTMVGLRNGVPYLYPAFDNGIICSPNSLLNGFFSIAVDDNSSKDIPERFIEVSAPEYRDMLKNYLSIISDDNIQDIFDKVESRIHTSIPMDVKVDLTRRFEMNYEALDELINKDKSRRSK